MNMGLEDKNPIAGKVATASLVIFVVTFLGIFPLQYLEGNGPAIASLFASFIALFVFFVADQLSGRDRDGDNGGGAF